MVFKHELLSLDNLIIIIIYLLSMTGSLFTKTTCLKFSVILFFALFLTRPVFAQGQSPAVPPQATCITPSGEKIAGYSNGTHGIVGDSNNFVGRDNVYNLGNAGALQCFCATDGNGVETIWWGSISELTKEQLESYTSSGWIYVPNGSLWGLDQKPYLAKNTRYLCSATGTGGEVSSITSQFDSQLLGVSTLAATGGKGLLFALMVASFLLLISGLLLKFRLSKN